VLEESRPKESEGFSVVTLGNPSTFPLGFHLCFMALPHKVRVWEETGLKLVGMYLVSTLLDCLV
jgi:hypothetical protein